MDHIPIRLHPLPQEDANGHKHAHDRDGEADVGDGVQVGVVLRHGVLVDVEDEGKVGEVGAGALGVGGVVAHLQMDGKGMSSVKTLHTQNHTKTYSHKTPFSD